MHSRVVRVWQAKGPSVPCILASKVLTGPGLLALIKRDERASGQTPSPALDFSPTPPTEDLSHLL